MAFAAPFLLGLAPGLRLPAVVLELVAGIVIGPSVLGRVDIDPTIEVMATLGSPAAGQHDVDRPEGRAMPIQCSSHDNDAEAHAEVGRLLGAGLDRGHARR